MTARTEKLAAYFGPMTKAEALEEAREIAARAAHYPTNDPGHARLRREAAALAEYAATLA